MRDISQRQATEDALADSEREHRSIIENMIDVFICTDIDGKIMMVSPSCLAMFGYTTEELIGAPIAQLYVDQEDRGCFLAAIVAAGGRVDCYLAKAHHKDGHEITVSSSSKHCRDADDRVISIEGITRDITEIINVNDALFRSETTLRDAQRIAQLGHWQWDLASDIVE